MSTIFLPSGLFCNGGKKMTIAEEIAELILPVVLEMMKGEKSSENNHKELDMCGETSIHCDQEENYND